MATILAPEDMPEYDPEAPPDLIPSSGKHPTEKVSYTTVVMGEVEGESLEELTGQVDIADLSKGGTGNSKPATGAIITTEQTWFAQGVALGSLLHSVALAPGESTRIAMVDWTRRTTAQTEEETEQKEDLRNETEHSRSISEVTRAVANEKLHGSSTSSSMGASGNVGYAVGMAGPPLLLQGISTGGAASYGRATTVSTSAGQRNLFADMTQDISDATLQIASSVRSRRASIVQEVTQREKETLTTRTITNYNHMHALSVQYYEVVQIYSTTTRISKIDKCLFIPMKIIKNWNRAMIDRYRSILYAAALHDRARRTLATSSNLVRIEPSLDVWRAARYSMSDSLREDLENARIITGGIVANDLDLPWKLDEAAQVTGVSVSGGLGIRGVEVKHQSQEAYWEVLPEGQRSAHIHLESPIPIAQIQSIHILISENEKGKVESSLSGEVTVSVHLLFRGRDFKYSFPVIIKDQDVTPEDDGIYAIEVANLKYEVPEYQWLITHLGENSTYYSQAIWTNLSSAALSLLLSPYKYKNKPLLQQIDPIPIAVTGNYVGFRMHVDPGEDKDWDKWLKDHGFYEGVYEGDGETLKNTAVHDTVPLPSGGVFAEAVLGRFNSAEKLDMTRFWNWQDSPIPFAAPEIAALQAGGKTQAINQTTGQLETPIVQQAAPVPLPDPQGLAALINAMTTSNMFRDISGAAQSAALAQAALQAAAVAATAAGQQAGTNMEVAGKYSIESLKAIANLAKNLKGLGAAGDSKTPPATAFSPTDRNALIEGLRKAGHSAEPLALGVAEAQDNGSDNGAPQDRANRRANRAIESFFGTNDDTDSTVGADDPGSASGEGDPGSIESIPLDPSTGGRSIDESALERGDIIVSTTSEDVSSIIRWATESEISHAVLYVGEGMVVESVKSGVRLVTLEKALEDDSLAVAFRHQALTEQEAQIICDYAGQQLGKKYDWWGITRMGDFVLNKRTFCNLLTGAAYNRCVNWHGLVNLGKKDSSFYCSELVIAAYQHAGVMLTDHAPHWSTPQDIVELNLKDKLGYVGHLKTP